MKELKIGQRVKIVHNDVAKEWSLMRFIGEEFVVQLGMCYHGDAIVALEGNGMGTWFVPPAACELVKE